MTRALLMLMLLARVLPGAEDGGQPVAWSKLALGARSAALGQAVSSLAGDTGAVLLNPALAVSQGHASLGSQAAFFPDGRQLNYVGIARPFWKESRFGWALGYAQYNVEQLYERRVGNTGSPDGTFKESASMTTLVLAGQLLEGRLHAGLGLKFFSHALGDASASGAAGDLGLWWRTNEWLDIGASARDLAGRLGWNSGTGEPLPMRLRAGGRLHLGQRYNLLLELDSPQQQSARLRAGAEAWVWAERLALRAGFDGALGTTGLGLRWPWLGFVAGLDYALAMDPLAVDAFQHRFSLELGVPL